MANHSLFPDAVLVNSLQLGYDITSWQNSDETIVSDVTSRGIVSGLAVTVDVANPLAVDVASGTAYANNGSRMTLAASQLNLAIPATPLGALNYVLLVYDEVASQPESRETDGTTQNTEATVSPRVVILNAAGYAALPATDPVLSNNALDRVCLIAIVSGNGTFVPLTVANIQGPRAFASALNVSQPINVTGVTIDDIDSTTPAGNGVLGFTASSKQLTWQAPGDGSPGSAVTITVSGNYTLTATSGHTLLVTAVYINLPATNTSDTIVVSNIYNQTIPVFTGEDDLHRSMIGSGIPTIKNPHGLTLADISAGESSELQEHQELEHDLGIWRGSNPALLSATVNTGTLPNSLVFTNFATDDVVYVHGVPVSALTTSNTVTFSPASTPPALYAVYLSQDGALTKQVRVAYPSVPTLNAITQVVNVSPGIGATTAPLQWTNAGQISFNGGPSKAAPSVDTLFRLYSQDRVNFIDVYIKGSSTPVSTLSDTLTFSASADLTQVLQLCYVPWSGSAPFSELLGFGFGSNNAPNNVYDTRLFGTTSAFNMRDDAGYVNVAQEGAEIHGDGIYIRTDPQTTIAAAVADEFALGSPTGLSQPINGGPIYVGGRRFDVSNTTLTLANSSTNLVYINQAGQVLTTTASLSGLTAAQLNKPFQLLWSIVTSGGSVSSSTDQRTYLSLMRNQPYGIAGLNKDGSLTVSPPGLTSSGNVISATVQSGLNGNAINATMSGTAGYAIAASSVGNAINATSTGFGNSAYIGSSTQGPAATLSGGTSGNPAVVITPNTAALAGTPQYSLLCNGGYIEMPSTVGPASGIPFTFPAVTPSNILALAANFTVVAVDGTITPNSGYNLGTITQSSNTWTIDFGFGSVSNYTIQITAENNWASGGAGNTHLNGGSSNTIVIPAVAAGGRGSSSLTLQLLTILGSLSSNQGVTFNVCLWITKP